ncbi:transcription repressor OFP3-like [Panicum virgatum]|nr:transcription repressor OFP3-like [Panicum virgatum]
MDHGGGGRSSSRLRDRLARMFRPASLLRSTCNTTASACSSSAAVAPAGAPSTTPKAPPPASACSSSRALLAADAAVARDSFLASSRRDVLAPALVARTESFSTAVDRLNRRAGAPLLEANASAKDKSPREYRLGGKNNNSSDKMKTKLLSNPYGFSTSDDDAHSDVFSSDAEDLAGRGGATEKLTGESAETFFCSSRSFSSDSSEFYTSKKKKKKTKPPAAASCITSKPPPKPPKQQRGQQAAGRRHRRAASGACDTCGVRDGFRPVVCAAEEQVRKGFAVVKRSRDPYADFRSSMVEMIVGRQLFGAQDMERLLRSYLSLNAPRHHPVILQAFSDIWVVVHDG